MQRFTSIVLFLALAASAGAQQLADEMTRVLASLEGVTYRVTSEVSRGGEEIWPAVDARVALQRTERGVAIQVEGSWQDGDTLRRFRCTDDGHTMTWVDVDINAHHTTQELATRQKTWSRAPLVQVIEPFFARPPTAEQLIGGGTTRTTTTPTLDSTTTRGLIITPRRDPAVASYDIALGEHDRLPRRITRELVGMTTSDGTTWRGRVTRTFTEVTPRFARLPEAELRDKRGAQVSTSSLRDRVTLVVFWATWCHACHEVLPVLADLGARHDVRLIGIHAHDDTTRRSDARKALAALSPSYEVLTDGTPLATQLSVTSLPTILVLDADGRLVTSSVGIDKASHSRINLALQRASEAPSLPLR